jgi:hypothetical protein
VVICLEKSLKNASSMDLQQRNIVKFLRVKGLRLGEIAKELSGAYGPDVYTPPSTKYWPHKIKLGTTDLRAQYAGGRAPLDEQNVVLGPGADLQVRSARQNVPFELHVVSPFVWFTHRSMKPPLGLRLDELTTCARACGSSARCVS